MDFSPETLRKHFARLTAEKNALCADLDPLRQELHDIVDGNVDMTIAEAKDREAAVRAQIVTLQNKVHPIEMERATVARALGGKTGDPSSAG